MLRAVSLYPFRRFGSFASPVMSHSRDINVDFYKNCIKYRIPVYFPQESGSIVVMGRFNGFGTLEITAFSPADKLIPLLQKSNEFIPTEASQLLPQQQGRDTTEGEREETLDTILSGKQGTHKTETQPTPSEPPGCYSGGCYRK